MKIKYLLLIFSFSFFSVTLFSQNERVEQVTIFGYRLKSPVVVDLITDRGNLIFNVTNKSLFKYDFEVTFDEFENLSPRVFEKKTILLPGLNKLFTFKIIDPEESPRLGYKTKYFISCSNLKGEKFNPYLIPVGRNKIVNYQSYGSDGSKKFIVNQFAMNQGDTIFNSRKGTVTALSDNLAEVDRLMNNSLEISHDDGTVAVYTGLNPNSEFVKLGQTVYPGQPLGFIGESGILVFRIYEIQSDGKVISIDVLYSGSNKQMVSAFNIMGTKVSYPSEIIKKEMTKRELSRYEKQTLY